MIVNSALKHFLYILLEQIPNDMLEDYVADAVDRADKKFGCEDEEIEFAAIRLSNQLATGKVIRN